jgi:hypothetical protein
VQRKAMPPAAVKAAREAARADAATKRAVRNGQVARKSAGSTGVAPASTTKVAPREKVGAGSKAAAPKPPTTKAAPKASDKE